MPLAPLVRVEDPVRAVPTVRVPLFCVVPLMAKLGILIVPVIVFELPLIVYTPEPAVKVWLLARLPARAMSSLPELFQVPLALTVTLPVNVFVPVLEEIVRVPVIEVAPETVNEVV